MIWSYSRITTFEDCPYRFYLSYIYKSKNKDGHFFSSYGTFMHKIIQNYLNGELKKEELTNYYLLNFNTAVKGVPPNKKTFINYLNQGLQYFEKIENIDIDLLGVEKQIEFSIDNRIFTGYIDLISRINGDLAIIDHKSKSLKNRSNNIKPKKSDMELDKYLRQLYLYSVAVKKEYGEFPKYLIFNCFRTQNKIIEEFKISDYEKAKEWALKSINDISREENWRPNVDEFKCRYICDCNSQCEYAKLNIGLGGI